MSLDFLVPIAGWVSTLAAAAVVGLGILQARSLTLGEARASVSHWGTGAHLLGQWGRRHLRPRVVGTFVVGVALVAILLPLPVHAQDLGGFGTPPPAAPSIDNPTAPGFGDGFLGVQGGGDSFARLGPASGILNPGGFDSYAGTAPLLGTNPTQVGGSGALNQQLNHALSSVDGSNAGPLQNVLALPEYSAGAAVDAGGASVVTSQLGNAADATLASSPAMLATQQAMQTMEQLQMADRLRRDAEARRQRAASGNGQVGEGVPYAADFNAAAERHGVDARMLAAVAKAESSFAEDIINCSRPSSAGALGIMQFIPSTAAGFGIDPCVPAQAIDGGARFLKGLYDQFGNWDLAFAGYNAGAGAVQRYGGIPPFPETQAYVPKVNRFWAEFREQFPGGSLSQGGTGELVWPTAGPMTSGFGQRWGALHAGIDVGAPTGQPIYAADGGTITYAGWMGGYGNTIDIDHGNGRTTRYAHQSGFHRTSGQVNRGDHIGFIGSTGDSTGPHLHFEVREGGQPRDPLTYLPPR